MKTEPVWIWGRHPVLEALRAGRVQSLLLGYGQKRSPILNDILDAATGSGVMVREAPGRELDRLAPGATTQGVAALVDLELLDTVDDVLTLATAEGRHPFILVLDQIQDPHNFGALLRTAEAAGIQAVIVPDRRSASLSGTVAKASAGAFSHLPLLEVKNLVRALDELRRGGIWTMGLDAARGKSVYGVDLSVPVALTIGSEGEGLRRLTREHCDVLLSIPMRGVIESLNASVAGSIAMYEVVRQRADLQM